MFISQFLQAFWRWCEFGGVGFARQAHRCQHCATVRFDIALQVCQRSAHTDKIIHQHVITSRYHDTLELGLPCQAPKSIFRKLNKTKPDTSLPLSRHKRGIACCRALEWHCKGEHLASLLAYARLRPLASFNLQASLL